eukprot:1189613-Prorocentrum_minimum.AAC.1
MPVGPESRIHRRDKTGEDGLSDVSSVKSWGVWSPEPSIHEEDEDGNPIPRPEKVHSLNLN